MEAREAISSPGTDGKESSRLLLRRAVGRAQIAPIDIGAKILAADSAAGGALDHRAALGWDASGKPLRDRTRRDADDFGQLALASYDFRSSFDWVHGISLAALNFECQEALNQKIEPLCTVRQ